MALVWCRAGVKRWAELLGGVEIEENVWLCEVEGERYLLSLVDGRAHLGMIDETVDV